MEMKEDLKREQFECEHRGHLKDHEHPVESTNSQNEAASTNYIAYECFSCNNLADDYAYQVEFSEFLPDYKISFEELTFHSGNYKSPAPSSSSSSSSSTTSSLSLSLDLNFNKPLFLNSSNVNCREVSTHTNCTNQALPNCTELQPKHFQTVSFNQAHNCANRDNMANIHTYPTHFFNSNYKQDVSVGTELSTNFNYKCKLHVCTLSSIFVSLD